MVMWSVCPPNKYSKLEIYITGCAVAQHCYNGDVSFLWEKMKISTLGKIETLEQIDTQFVKID